MPKLTFSTVTCAELKQIVDLDEEVDDSKFANWLCDDQVLDSSDTEFLSNLASRHRKNIDAYSEEDVRAKLIIPIVNRDDFTVNGFTDW